MKNLSCERFARSMIANNLEQTMLQTSYDILGCYINSPSIEIFSHTIGAILFTGLQVTQLVDS